MSLQVIFSDSTHRDFHPSYEGNHQDHNLSLLPIFMPLSLPTVPNTYSLRDPIQSSKALYPLLRVYQAFESTHFWKGLKGLRRLREADKAEEKRSTKKIKKYAKNKVQKFINTYRKEKSILGQASKIWKGNSEWGEVGKFNEGVQEQSEC